MRVKDIVNKLDEQGLEYVLEKFEDCEIKGFSSLFQYKDGTITFIVPEKNFEELTGAFTDRQIAFIVISKEAKIYNCYKNVIRAESPRKLFFEILDMCFDTGSDETITGISSDPEIYKRYSYIAPGAVIGKNVKIGIGCVIEGNVVIGDETEIHHNVVIRNKTTIGKRCMIHSGVIIGEYGFGSIANDEGGRTMLKHYGGVTIEDDVHIGDNSVIIRGALDNTVVKHGVKMNTMVHIAHNDVIGENTIITSPIHVCGSVTIGHNCHIAGTTIRNQRNVGDYAKVGLGAVVVKDVEERTVVVGNPAKAMEKK